MSKTVYFLGAGATKAVEPNAPLDRDLLEKALNDFRDQRVSDAVSNVL